MGQPVYARPLRESKPCGLRVRVQDLGSDRQLNFTKTILSNSSFRHVVQPRLSSGFLFAATLMAGSLHAGLFRAQAQVLTSPRYTGGVDAPVKQLNLPALPRAITPHGTVVEDVVVRVNDQIISRSDVERSLQQLQEEAAANNLSSTDLATRQRDNLRDLIDQQLLLSRAKELGLNADADVIRKLDEIRKQNKLESLDDLEKAARAQGVSFEDFKAQIRNQLLTQLVVRDEVGRKLQVSEGDQKKYYADHIKDFEQPEQVRLNEILVPLPDTATPAEIAQAEAKANALKAELQKGTDFAEVAKKSSGGPSAAQGGELGLFKRGALAKVLEDQTFALKVGEATAPIRTRQGFVILKVTEHDPAGPAPMKDVEPQIQEAIYIQAVQPALRAYLTKLREDSYLDLQPGFVDSGASYRETKPVFTAYAPPPIKKKKVKNKARFDRTGRITAAAANKPVVASPDTNGGRTLTGSEAKTEVDAATGLAVLPASAAAPATTASDKSPRGRSPSGKAPKRPKREKVRFGQTPRDSIPAGTDDVAVGTDVNSAPTSTANAAPAGVQVTPTAASSAMETASSPDLADNPLTPPAPEKTKTRFSAKAKEEKAKKVKVLTAKQQEKALATASPITADEKVTQTAQSAPLGLSGDTTKKKVRKPKRVKGTPKQRLEEKKPVVKQAPPEVDQTASPNLAPTNDTLPTPGMTPSPAAPATTPLTPRPVPQEPDTALPPVTQPVPGTQPPA